MIDSFKMYFLPCLINILTAFYLSGILIKKKIDFKKISTYVLILTYVIISIINYIYVSQSFRVITSTISISIFSTLMFREKLYKTFSASIILQTLLFVAELIYALTLTTLKADITLLSSTVQGTLITNIVISLMAILLIDIKYIKDISERLLNYIFQMENINNYVLLLFFLLTLNVLLVFMYFSSNDKTIVIINVIFMIIYAIIMYFLINEKSENIRFKNENKMLIENLNEYEKMLDYQRVSNHENKNQLLVIRGMLNSEKQVVLDYIDEIIKEKRVDNEILFTETKRIPTGGLQGLIYQKMLVMQENNIPVEINISKNVRKLDYSNISAKLNYDICRAVGIILDNAIDECKKNKKKGVFISMYAESGILNIEISNYFEGQIDIEKIFQKGYTTKSDGHGYGLTLLQEIVEKNEKISNETVIIKNIFMQTIKIKI